MSVVHVDEHLAGHQELLPLGGQATPRGKSLLEDVSVFALIGTTAISAALCNNRVGYGVIKRPRRVYITSKLGAGRSVVSQ